MTLRGQSLEPRATDSSIRRARPRPNISGGSQTSRVEQPRPERSFLRDKPIAGRARDGQRRAGQQAGFADLRADDEADASRACARTTASDRSSPPIFETRRLMIQRAGASREQGDLRRAQKAFVQDRSGNRARRRCGPARRTDSDAIGSSIAKNG